MNENSFAVSSCLSCGSRVRTTTDTTLTKFSWERNQKSWEDLHDRERRLKEKRRTRKISLFRETCNDEKPNLAEGSKRKRVASFWDFCWERNLIETMKQLRDWQWAVNHVNTNFDIDQTIFQRWHWLSHSKNQRLKVMLLCIQFECFWEQMMMMMTPVMGIKRGSETGTWIHTCSSQVACLDFARRQMSKRYHFWRMIRLLMTSSCFFFNRWSKT